MMPSAMRTAKKGALVPSSAQMIAVAMEGAGVAKAVKSEGNPPRYLEVRGISDYAGPDKHDGWHEALSQVRKREAVLIALFGSCYCNQRVNLRFREPNAFKCRTEHSTPLSVARSIER